MIKVFEIITSVNVGGAENVVFNLVENCSLLYPDAFEFTILELHSSPSFYSKRKKVELRSKGIKVITLGGSKKRESLLLAPVRLFAYLKKERPAIIHSHTDLPDFVLSIVLRFLKLKNSKIVRTIHNTDLWSAYPAVGKFVESAFHDDDVIGVSKAAIHAYDKARNTYKLPVSTRTSVIYNGCPVPKPLTHHFTLDKGKYNIAFCGRFFYQKGVDILVKVLGQLDIKLKDNLAFHFIGDGPDKNLIEKLAEENDNVFLYAPVSNLSGKIYGFDYLIMPSRFEGFPLISLESSLSKVPVIASRAPGLDETLPADWPLFFNLEHPEEIDRIFENIVNSFYTAKDLRNVSFDFAVKKFSLEEMSSHYSKIYTS